MISVGFAWMFGEYGLPALSFGMVSFAIIAVACLLSLIESAHYLAVVSYIEALIKLDDDLRNALAFSVPSLRLIAHRGQVQTLFADTHATREHIHLYLIDSTKTNTASRRNWNTAERPRWAWDEICAYLLDHKMVGGVASGPESYPWVGTAYQNLSIYFLSASLPDLGSGMVYASETDEVQIGE